MRSADFQIRVVSLVENPMPAPPLSLTIRVHMNSTREWWCAFSASLVCGNLGARMSASIFGFHADSHLWDLRPADPIRYLYRPAAQNVLELFFARTLLGDAEVQRPVCELPRAARQLLFIVDQSVAIDKSVSEIHEAGLADAMLLLGLGLVRTASFEARYAKSAGLRPLIDAILRLSSQELYTLLTQQAKQRLGLLQGFRMVLALERCKNQYEQSALAVRFVQEIWRTQGEAGIHPLRGLLRT
jgi:hypothetical protein